VRSVESVEQLWESRAEIMQRNKRHRVEKLFETFLEMVENLARGEEYDPDRMRSSPWFQYIRQYYQHWQEEPLSERADRELRERMQDGIDLFHDIKQNGMRDPLEMFMDRGKRNLILGNRRLVILHVLGIPEAEVLTHASFEAYCESQEAKAR